MALTPPNDTAPNLDDSRQAPDNAAATPDSGAEATRQGVRRQREHIIALTGEDPLRGGVAD